jgi:hypothetical protein
MAVQTSITELDFSQIKDNLKTFLQGQDRFKDYNFEGSNMNVFLDVLAYNTFHNNFYANMAINEMFLDSAQLRESVVSHAKGLNYIPRSRTGARARVNLALSVNDSPAFVTIPSKTKFNAQCGSKTFTFYNTSAVTIYPLNNAYTYTNLEIIEGSWVTESFEVLGDTNERFILSNDGINTGVVKVYIKANAAATTSDEYVLRNSIFGVEPTAKAFYLQAAEDNKYEIVFGQDKFGAQPIAGNVINVEYMVTNGEEANGITSFALPTNISGYPTNVTLAVASEGGAERESIESIKYYAPRSIQVQDRAVTASDYEILLKTRYPEIQAVSVYGGEELNPPRYGRVVIAVDVQDADGVSENNKRTYAAFLRERSPVSIEPLVISPEFMYLSVNTTVYFNTKTTALGESDIRSKVTTALQNYSDTYLNDFKIRFKQSNLSSAIDASDPNIISNDIEVLPIIPLNPALNIANNFDVSFGNELVRDQRVVPGETYATHKPAIRSSTFTFRGQSCLIKDDGLGVLTIIRLQGESFVVVNGNIGSVDYATGRVVIRNLNVSSYIGSEIKLFGRTVAQTITAPKSRILSIRANTSDVNVNIVGVND